MTSMTSNMANPSVLGMPTRIDLEMKRMMDDEVEQLENDAG
jgi:hypothetical protein